MGERLSPFQERKRGEQEWLGIGKIRTEMLRLQDKINQEYGADVGKTPAAEIPAAKTAAEKYLRNVQGEKPALDQLAQSIMDLPETAAEPEAPITTEKPETPAENLEEDIDEVG